MSVLDHVRITDKNSGTDKYAIWSSHLCGPKQPWISLGSRSNKSILHHHGWPVDNLGTQVSCAKMGEPIQMPSEADSSESKKTCIRWASRFDQDSGRWQGGNAVFWQNFWTTCYHYLPYSTHSNSVLMYMISIKVLHSHKITEQPQSTPVHYHLVNWWLSRSRLFKKIERNRYRDFLEQVWLDSDTLRDQRSAQKVTERVLHPASPITPSVEFIYPRIRSR